MSELMRLLDNLISLTKSGKINWRADDGYAPKKFFLSTPSFRIIFLVPGGIAQEFIIHDEEGNIIEDIPLINVSDPNMRNMFVALLREINQKIMEKRKKSLDKLIGEVVQLGNK